MYNIPIFKAERELGLADRIRASARVIYASQAIPSAPFELTKKLAASFKDKVVAENQGQPDLYYFKSLLAKTGWNLNTDVFDRVELLSARHTPEDKQVNYDHQGRQIVGHITSSYLSNDKYERLDDSQAVDELPDPFSIVTSSVLYQCFPDDKEHQEFIDSIIDKIEAGKLYVSMECLIKNFDYAIITPTNEYKVIARTEESAYLTKYLKAYGGDGIYQGHKIGRLLRNFIFSGKGLVEKPAEPDAVIFSFASFTPLKQNASPDLVYSSMEDSCMATENIVNEKLEAEVKELKAALKASEQAIKDLDGKAVASKIADFEKQIEDKTKAVTAAHEQVAVITKAKAELEAKVAELEKGKSESEKAMAELQKTHQVVATELKEMKDKAVQAERLATVKDLVEDAKAAEKLVASLVALNDEQFKAVIATYPKKTDKPKETVTVGDTIKTQASQIEEEDEDEEVDLALITAGQGEEGENKLKNTQKAIAAFLNAKRGVKEGDK